MGGDSDTIGAIVGGLAQAHYGVPENLRARALEFLPEEMKAIVEEFENTEKTVINTQIVEN